MLFVLKTMHDRLVKNAILEFKYLKGKKSLSRSLLLLIDYDLFYDNTVYIVDNVFASNMQLVIFIKQNLTDYSECDLCFQTSFFLLAQYTRLQM